MAPKKMHFAINTFNRDQVSEAQLAKYGNVIYELKSNQAQITEVNHAYTKYQRDVMRCEFKHDLEEYLSCSSAQRQTLEEIVDFYEKNPDKMMKYGDAYLRGALEGASGKLDDAAYIKAMSERKRLRYEIIESISKYDACLMTGPTNIMHFIGIPSVAIRLGMADDGTPRGMILYGADEQRLFSAALTLEKYCQPVTMPKL